MKLYYEELLHEFVDICKLIMGDQLTGIYLHGSMAMGCFNQEKSDIDLIVLVEMEMSEKQKKELMDQIVCLNQKAPAKGLEISFVKKEYCKPFVYPTPFELHFSTMHLKWYQNDPIEYVKKMNGEDEDLAAHFMIINHYGIVLYGKEVTEVFGEVPQKDYLDSIYSDIQNAIEDILSNPIYIILNLCRILAYCQENLILSKKQGGEWGMIHLDGEYKQVVKQALNCYTSNQAMDVEANLAEKFAGIMVRKISSYKQRNNTNRK